MIVAIPVPTIEVQTYPGPSVAITVPETANFIKNLRIKMIWAKLKQKIPIRAVNYWPKMWGWAVSRKCPKTLKRFLIYIYGTFEHQKCRKIDVKYQLPRRKNENKLKKNLTQPLSFLSERPRGQAVSYSQRNPLSLAAFNPTEGINR